MKIKKLLCNVNSSLVGDHLCINKTSFEINESLFDYEWNVARIAKSVVKDRVFQPDGWLAISPDPVAEGVIEDVRLGADNLSRFARSLPTLSSHDHGKKTFSGHLHWSLANK